MHRPQSSTESSAVARPPARSLLHPHHCPLDEGEGSAAGGPECSLRREVSRLQAVVQVQREVAAASPNLQAVLEVVVARAAALCGASGAVVELLEGEEMVYRAASGAALPHLGLRLRVDASLSGLCARTGEVLRCDDSWSDPRVDRAASDRIGLRSMLLAPLLSEGRAVGVLKVFSPEPSAFEEHDAELLELLAGMVGSTLSLSLQLELLHAFYESVPVMLGVCELVGDDFRFVSVNAATAALFGLTPERVSGRLARELGSPPAAQQAFLGASRRALPGEGPVRLEYARGEGAERRFMSGSLARLGVPDREWICFALEDVTEKRVIQEQLAQRDRLASLGTLAGGAAHEINNPLAYTLGNIHFAVASLGPVLDQLRALPVTSPRLVRIVDDVRQALVEAAEGGERVRRIVSDLRAFARGGTDPEQPLEVGEVLAGAVKMLGQRAGSHVRVRPPQGPVPLVRGSKVRLGQLVLNLLLNAAQALDADGREDPLIELGAEADAQGRAVIVVRDNGPGMPPEVRQRIFEPFFTTKPVGQGTGLGLFICHGLVDQMGGEIRVESAPGRGTEVRIALPAIG